MKKVILFAGMLLLASTTAFGKETAPTDREIAELLISESISNYYGNCPCPYNSASNGSRCGKRSAYSRPGGESPLCYVEDVSPSMIARYRERLDDKSATSP